MPTRTIASITQERRALNDPDDQFLYVIDGYNGRVTEKMLFDEERDGLALDTQDEFERTVGQVLLQYIPLADFKQIEQIWGKLHDVDGQIEGLSTEMSENEFAVAFKALDEQGDELGLKLQEVIIQVIKAL